MSTHVQQERFTVGTRVRATYADKGIGTVVGGHDMAYLVEWPHTGWHATWHAYENVAHLERVVTPEFRAGDRIQLRAAYGNRVGTVLGGHHFAYLVQWDGSDHQAYEHMNTVERADENPYRFV